MRKPLYYQGIQGPYSQIRTLFVLGNTTLSWRRGGKCSAQGRPKASSVVRRKKDTDCIFIVVSDNPPERDACHPPQWKP